MATTNIKRSTSASRLINYAEKSRPKDGHNIQIDYAKTEFKQVREVFGNLAVRKPMPVGLRFRLMNLTHKAKKTS